MTHDFHEWLIETKIKHPLFDLDTTKELLDRLPSDNSLATLQEISKWITEIIQIPNFPLQKLLNVLDLLDRLAKNHQLTLVPEYLDTTRMWKISESQLWTTSFEFWKNIGNAYLLCLERFQAGEADSKKFRHNLPLIVGRILRSLSLQLKWTLLRYTRVEERLWRDIGRAYLLAGNWGFSTRRCAIYPGSHGESSIQEEFLKPLMLCVSAPNTLTPLQQHIAERIVAFFGSRFEIHIEPKAGCFFSFDLSMHMPPKRARKGAAPSPLLRFFGPGMAAEGLHELIEHIEQHGTLPPYFPIGGNFQASEIKTVADHLVHCWTEPAAIRHSKRREVMTRLTVVPGLVESVRWIERILEEESADIANPKISESWVVHDVSKGGYGTVVSAQPGDWLKIGALISVHSEATPSCRMAIVRRISFDADDLHKVGLQLISEAVAPAALFSAGSRLAADQNHCGETAILIIHQADKEGVFQLLLRPGHFEHDKTLQMRFRDKIYKIKYLQTIEQTHDYHWASYQLTLAD